MTHLRTPADGSSSPLARELLELARSERANAEIYEHAEQAGLRVLGGTAAAASGAAGWLASGGVIKLVATAGVLALGSGLWRLGVAERPVDALTRPPVVQPSGVRAAGFARSAARIEAGAASSAAPSPASALPSASTALGARAVNPATSASTRSSDELSREIAIVDRARALLSAGDARGALRAVEAQRMQILVPEALALKIEALTLSGDGLRAAKLAARFLEDHPASPLVGRVAALQKSLTGEAPPP